MENDQCIIGALLIILAMVLLWCLSNKNNEEFKNSQHGSFKWTDGFNSNERVAQLGGGIKFNDNSPVPSMHEIENGVELRNVSKNSDKQPFTVSKWYTDASLGNEDDDNYNTKLHANNMLKGLDYASSGETIDVLRDTYEGIRMPKEILTPMKTDSVTSSAYKSVSGSLLALTDFTPQYGTSYNNSVSI